MRNMGNLPVNIYPILFAGFFPEGIHKKSQIRPHCKCFSDHSWATVGRDVSDYPLTMCAVTELVSPGTVLNVMLLPSFQRRNQPSDDWKVSIFRSLANLTAFS